MIPKIVPPLTGVTVLATRPQPQCAQLCACIERLGGVAIALPAIEIQPLSATPPGRVDLAIFVSVNAVEHGAQLIEKHAGLQAAAVGRATAAALAAAGFPSVIAPEAGFDSEALLAHPALQDAAPRSVAIVRGEGGRELLHETFAARGADVHLCEVYRRVQPQVDPERISRIEQIWEEEGIDFVTIGSVQTLQHLTAMLSERGRRLLQGASLVVPSERVMSAASQAGLHGVVIVARGPDDAAMVGAIASWQARARA